VRENLMLVLELDLEERIGQRFYHHCHDFNCIFLRQTISFNQGTPRENAG
jgi:hypothetical protein